MGKLTGCAVDHRTNLWVFIELAEELLRHLIVTDLGELESNTTAAVLREPLLQGVESVSDGIEDSVLGLASRLTISDGNDENGLPELILLSLSDDDLVDDLLAKRSTHGRETLKLNTTHNGLNLSLGSDTILERPALLVTHAREVSVHETNRDAVSIEEGSGERDTLQNKAQVLDTRAFLFELHRSTVVDVEHDIVKSELHDIVGNLLLDAPALDDLVDLSGRLLCNLVEDRCAWRVECLESLLLDTIL